MALRRGNYRGRESFFSWVEFVAAGEGVNVASEGTRVCGNVKMEGHKGVKITFPVPSHIPGSQQWKCPVLAYSYQTILHYSILHYN